MLELRRCDFSQQARQFDRWRMGGLKKTVVVRQLEHLAIRHVGQVAAPVAQIDAPQARHAIENLIAVGIVQIHAFRPGNDPGSLAAERGMIRERMNVMCSIQRLPFGSGTHGHERAGRRGHGWLLSAETTGVMHRQDLIQLQ